MANDRVDKGWTKKGLDAYSTEAILGTLAHYGVSTDEGGFKGLAEGQFPLQIAREWSTAWKGTGQFAAFPLAAADTLWARWLSDRAAPVTVAKSVLELLNALAAKRGGATDAPVSARFADAEKLLGQAPKQDGQIDPRFSEEVLTRLSPESLKGFDDMAEGLAKEGHAEDADAFARLEEALLPERAGVVTAVVQSVRGDKAGATGKLLALSRDTTVNSEKRLLAVDALIHIGANAEAEARAAEMLDVAEKEEDYHLGLDLAGRLEHLYSERNAETELRRLVARAQVLHDAHSKAHPHHHH